MHIALLRFVLDRIPAEIVRPDIAVQTGRGAIARRVFRTKKILTSAFP